MVAEKGTKVCSPRQVALANVEALLGQHHDGTPLGRLVGQRGQLGGVGHLCFAVRRRPGRSPRPCRLPEGDGAGLVQEQGLDVTRRLHRPAAHGQHVALHQAVHAGDPDGREQGPDGGRDEAHQQGDQDHHRDVAPA